MTNEKDIKEALDRAAKLVADLPDDLKDVAFREAYRDLVAPGGAAETRRATRTHTQRRKKAPKSETRVKESSNAKSRNTGRPAPKAVMEGLLDTGFFNEPQTIGEVQRHLETKRGHSYKTKELSTPLVRLLRDGRLDREKNEEG